jgi:Peptidase A4 family
MQLPQKTRVTALAVAAAISLALAAPSIAAAAPGPSGGSSPIGPVQRVAHSTVYNNHWSGYAAASGKGAFTSITASWTQPSADCTTTPNAYASFWVGLDGYNSNTVEQIGTDSDCRSGSPNYYAWYEMYPKNSGQLFKLSAGDSVTATVTTNGTGSFTLSISVNSGPATTINSTNKRAALSSAEVIAEAPSSNHGPFGTLALTAFGTVSFSGATVNGTTLLGDTTPAPDEIIMTTTGTSSGTIKAQPSGISGGSFTVTRENA